jgi:hypothetical protein
MQYTQNEVNELITHERAETTIRTLALVAIAYVAIKLLSIII